MSLIDKNDSILEIYRSIRTNIEFCNIDENIKVIMVTSSQPNEGKSTFISNLSITFSNLENKNILLIDCDLRKPTIHKIFGISHIDGLTDILVKNKKIKDCIKYSNGVSIITSGSIPLNPSEILASKKMEQFINSIRDEYDYIFIDTPPIAILTDAEIISGISDGTILIIGCGEVDRKNVKLAKEKLDNLNANILGAVVNKEDTKKYAYYYEDKPRKKFANKFRMKK
jgi:capsular exopolysaccharide synthesis family protein